MCRRLEEAILEVEAWGRGRGAVSREEMQARSVGEEVGKGMGTGLSEI